jgi:hypothetical protein
MKTEPEDVCLDRPIKEIWDQVLELLSKRLSTPNFRSWILPLQVSELTAENVVVKVLNDFARLKVVGLTSINSGGTR